MESVNSGRSLGQKKIERVFKLEVKLPDRLRRWTRDVIQNIENDQLLVLDPNHTISIEPEHNGTISIDKGFSRPVSIREWLPLGCQYVRTQSTASDEFKSDSALACYKSNAMDVITPCGASYLPAGPAAFYGEIVLASDFVRDVCRDPRLRNRFKFVIAHELVHVFDLLKILVPAFQNWKRFWEVCLDDGAACQDAGTLNQYRSVFLDDYGSVDELAMVRQYWPTKAERWFAALRT